LFTATTGTLESYKDREIGEYIEYFGGKTRKRPGKRVDIGGG
jgi:hypothetical protein